jgi:hypothetical protein
MIDVRRYRAVWHSKETVNRDRRSTALPRKASLADDQTRLDLFEKPDVRNTALLDSNITQHVAEVRRLLRDALR